MTYRFIRAASVEAMADIDVSSNKDVNNFINEAILEKCERLQTEFDEFQEAHA